MEAFHIYINPHVCLLPGIFTEAENPNFYCVAHTSLIYILSLG